MIIGVGTDVCDSGRIAAAIARHGDLFLRRVFTPGERSAARSRRNPAAYFGRRFAAKEAFVKALGTGITERIGWTDIEVLNAPSGAPAMALAGGAKQQIARLASDGRAGIVHVSLAGEGNVAMATVAIEVR